MRVYATALFSVLFMALACSQADFAGSLDQIDEDYTPVDLLVDETGEPDCDDDDVTIEEIDLLPDCLEGEPCDDGNVCTHGDRCIEGTCTGENLACADENPCTDDSCDPLTGCVFHTNTLPCDDQEPCTVGDHCTDGVCLGTSVDCQCNADSDCDSLDDGDACTGTLICNRQLLPFRCEVDPSTVSICDDLVPAENQCQTVACDPETGNCFLASIRDGEPCSDGDNCTLDDQCDAGVCKPGALFSCPDDNPCTDDLCDSTVGCLHVPNADSCDDGSVCTQVDACVDGQCVGAQPLPCDDDNLCTNDLCDPIAGCVHTPNEIPCDDGDSCTINDRCLESQCAAQPISCDDGKACTNDSCDPIDGCHFDPSCPEGLHCNGDGGCCLPRWSCGTLGHECGPIADGCDSEVACSPCPAGASCVDGICATGSCGFQQSVSLGGLARDVRVHAGYAYVAHENTLVVYNVETPGAATFVRSQPLPFVPRRLYLHNQSLLVVGDHAVAAISLITPGEPAIDAVLDGFDTIVAVAISGETVFVAQHPDTVTILEWAAGSIQPVGWAPLPGGLEVVDVEILDGRFLAATRTQGLWVFNIGASGSLEFAFSAASGDVCLGLVVSQGVAYLQKFWSGLEVIAFAEDGEPLPGAVIPLELASGRGFVWNQRLLLPRTQGGLWTLDVSNPETPVPDGFLDFQGFASGFDYQAPYLFVSGGANGLEIYSSPELLYTTLVESRSLPYRVNGMALFDGTLATVQENGQVHLLDVRNPSVPLPTESWKVPGIPVATVALTSTLHIASKFVGLLTYRMLDGAVEWVHTDDSAFELIDLEPLGDNMLVGLDGKRGLLVWQVDAQGIPSLTTELPDICNGPCVSSSSMTPLPGLPPNRESCQWTSRNPLSLLRVPPI